MRHEGKSVLITGGSRGIGAALAVAFAKAGYGQVGINYVNSREEAEKVRQAAEACGAVARTYQANVGQRVENERMMDAFLEDFGKIDVLINNAGGALKIPEGGFVDMPMEYWDQQINLNLNAAVYASHEAVKNMLDKGIKGSIINISSIHGRITWVKRKMLPYTAAKAGMEMFTKALGVEVAKQGIRLNCIAPGFISTEATKRYNDEELAAFRRKIPLGELGTVDDITPLALFLADETCSRFIIGQTFVVDGGQSIDGAMDSLLK